MQNYVQSLKNQRKGDAVETLAGDWSFRKKKQGYIDKIIFEGEAAVSIGFLEERDLLTKCAI